MKFFHVYNENSFKGLEKNGLLNEESGLKIQHAFSVPEKYKFNKIAAKDSVLYNIIKDNKMPFYVDRIAGGIIYHKYDFNPNLIYEYKNILADWFLGFQLHESGSNLRNSDWPKILKSMNGKTGPYDAKKLNELSKCAFAKMPDGTILSEFSQDSPEHYATRCYAQTVNDCIEEIKDLFKRRMDEVSGMVLPCDSYYILTKLQDELGMNSFMPEVGCQIPLMRQQIAVTRGIAKSSKKTWGVYYECWREIRENNKSFYSMPCYNSDSSNEWYLTQETHPDDFTSYGKNGGSSRLLQNRIYYYALMAGAHYFSEEWGLNCSYSDMSDFSLSEYGTVKKNFINDSLNFKGIKAIIPFAIVLPKKYSCIELEDMFSSNELGVHRSEYMRCKLSQEEKEYYGHIEDVLKLIFSKTETIGNEDHVITNSRFPDVFDIIYEDATDDTFSQYEYLIDATKDGDFQRKKHASHHNILESGDIHSLEKTLHRLIEEIMPCYADDLCWLVSVDKRGQRYLSIFNNAGNERSLEKGDIIHCSANKTVNITFKDSCEISLLKESPEKIDIQKNGETSYKAVIPAAGFAIIKF